MDNHSKNRFQHRGGKWRYYLKEVVSVFFFSRFVIVDICEYASHADVQQ